MNIAIPRFSIIINHLFSISGALFCFSHSHKEVLGEEPMAYQEAGIRFFKGTRFLTWRYTE